MKIIPTQNISAVTAGSEDTNYPDDNVLDLHPKKVWKANSTYTSTLTLTVAGPNNGIAVFNTNAISINVTVTDPNYFGWDATDIAWSSGDIVWAAEDAAVIDELYRLDGDSGSAWIEWPAAIITVECELTLTCESSATLYAGTVIGGQIYEFTCPQIGVTEGLVNYSIVRELQNGATYVKNRDSVRAFSFTFIEDRALAPAQTTSDFYRYMYDVAKVIGFNPAAWYLTEMDDTWWIVFARFQDMPIGTHSLPNDAYINTNIIEVL